MENYDPTLTTATSSSDTGITSGASARKVSMSPPTYSQHKRPKKKKRNKKENKVKTEEAQTEAASDAEKEAEGEGEDVEEADEITYEPYQPAKLKYGRPHPDPVVENATLAAVAPPGMSIGLSLALSSFPHVQAGVPICRVCSHYHIIDIDLCPLTHS